jgi:hypothetical protein
MFLKAHLRNSVKSCTQGLTNQGCIIENVSGTFISDITYPWCSGYNVLLLCHMMGDVHGKSKT